MPCLYKRGWIEICCSSAFGRSTSWLQLVLQLPALIIQFGLLSLQLHDALSELIPHRWVLLWVLSFTQIPDVACDTIDLAIQRAQLLLKQVHPASKTSAVLPVIGAAWSMRKMNNLWRCCRLRKIARRPGKVASRAWRQISQPISEQAEFATRLAPEISE